MTELTVLTDDELALLDDDTKAFGHVATIGPGGAPQSTPVWVTTDGDHLLFSVTTDRQKYRNLERDPHVAVSLTDPDDPYTYLEVRGKVAMEMDPDNELIDRLARKYIDHDSYPWHQPGDERVVVKVHVEHTTGMG